MVTARQALDIFNAALERHRHLSACFGEHQMIRSEVGQALSPAPAAACASAKLFPPRRAPGEQLPEASTSRPWQHEMALRRGDSIRAGGSCGTDYLWCVVTITPVMIACLLHFATGQRHVQEVIKRCRDGDDIGLAVQASAVFPYSPLACRYPFSPAVGRCTPLR